jgi:hypothetical protein
MLALHIVSLPICVICDVAIHIILGVNHRILWGMAIVGFPLLSLVLSAFGRRLTQHTTQGTFVALYVSEGEPMNEER